MPKNHLTEEDKALFREAMRDVSPLKEKKTKVEHSDTSADKTHASRAVAAPRAHKDSKDVKTIMQQSSSKVTLPLSDTINNPVQSNTILSYSVPGIPKKRFLALKKGLIPWEGRLDLHGLNTENARTALITFLQAEVYAKKRCVLIIHGKGGQHSTLPIIKNCMNRWLPQIPEVLAFHSALPKDGGSGALYVLLKPKFVG